MFHYRCVDARERLDDIIDCMRSLPWDCAHDGLLTTMTTRHMPSMKLCSKTANHFKWHAQLGLTRNITKRQVHIVPIRASWKFGCVSNYIDWNVHVRSSIVRDILTRLHTYDGVGCTLNYNYHFFCRWPALRLVWKIRLRTAWLYLSTPFERRMAVLCIEWCVNRRRHGTHVVIDQMNNHFPVS